MPTFMIIPKLGIAQDTGRVVRWLKAEGEQVYKGEAVVEIETDKAVVELEAPADGIFSQLVSVDEEVPVGEVIARILAPGETLQEEPSSTPATAQAGIMPASPKARRKAAEYGLDIQTIKGTGPDSAVLFADVMAAHETVPEASSLSTTWHIMAERTTGSWTNIPHFFLLREVNATRLIAWREQLLKRLKVKATYTDLLVKVVSVALGEHRNLYATWNKGTIVYSNEINIGVVAAVEGGLVVPVIHQADTLSLQDIVMRRADLVTRAQSGRLRPDDLQGGTFTISNLGMYGVDAFTAIINPPQSAILAVGRIVERIVPIKGQPMVQPMMMLSLSCDHRVIDGVRGAQFLTTLSELLEEPLGMLQ